MKPRHHVYLDDGLTEQLEFYAAKPGSSKSAIVSDALRSLFARRGAIEVDDLLKSRLDRISRQLNTMNRDQQVVMESLALFIHYELTITPPLPEGDQSAARAVGLARFQNFIEQVGRRIASSKSLSREVIDRITPAEGAPLPKRAAE